VTVLPKSSRILSALIDRRAALRFSTWFLDMFRWIARCPCECSEIVRAGRTQIVSFPIVHQFPDRRTRFHIPAGVAHVCFGHIVHICRLSALS
jgi:hypothetical protein